MASAISTSFEVILYPTRATRCTGEFSRETMGVSFVLPPRPEQRTGKFRLAVTWGNEEAFTISNLFSETTGDAALASPRLPKENNPSIVGLM
jgi:hypothetical protein